MGCTGGCINGGGQPIVPAYIADEIDIRKLRAEALYKADKDLPLRKSHENPVIKKLYDEYLGTPGSELAHKLFEEEDGIAF